MPGMIGPAMHADHSGPAQFDADELMVIGFAPRPDIALHVMP